jgi:hypothetical protein
VGVNEVVIPNATTPNVVEIDVIGSSEALTIFAASVPENRRFTDTGCEFVPIGMPVAASTKFTDAVVLMDNELKITEIPFIGSVISQLQEPNAKSKLKRRMESFTPDPENNFIFMR